MGATKECGRVVLPILLRQVEEVVHERDRGILPRGQGGNRSKGGQPSNGAREVFEGANAAFGRASGSFDGPTTAFEGARADARS